MNTQFLLIRCFFFVLESEAATSNPPDKESKSDSSSAEPKSEDAVKSEDSGVISAVKEPSVEDELQAKLTLEDEKSNSDPKTEVEPAKAEKSWNSKTQLKLFIQSQEFFLLTHLVADENKSKPCQIVYFVFAHQLSPMFAIFE